MTQRVLVTGSNGYIGGGLTRRLMQCPDTEVFGFNRTHDAKLQPGHCLADDLLDVDLRNWLSQIQPDVIYHCIGASPKSSFENQLRINAEGTRRLLQALVDAGLRPTVIIVGSAAEYGLRNEPVDENTPCQPEGEYGIAKLAQTQIAQSYARRYELPVIIGRVFNVFGQTGQHLAVASLASQIAQVELLSPACPELRVFNLKSRRDFVHIDDLVSALMALSALAPKNKQSGQIYNIASGQSTALYTVLERLLDQSKLSETQRQQLQLEEQAPQQADCSWANIAKISQQTGWQPQVSLDAGLIRELDYWRAHLEAQRKRQSGHPTPYPESSVLSHHWLKGFLKWTYTIKRYW